MKILLLVFYLFILIGCEKNYCDPKVIQQNYFSGQEILISAPMAIKDIEKKETVEIVKDGKHQSVPFGALKKDWEKMLEAYNRRTDCFVHFRTGERSWKSLSGREGYLHIRKNEVVDAILTRIS